jgi:predicted RecA/RadA family phage recombinase
MKNYVQKGGTVSFVAAADALSGSGVMLSATLFGVNSYDVKTGETGEAAIEGVFTLPKAAVVTTAFAAAYFDNTAKLVTNVSSGNALIGAFTEASASGVATPVRLIPKAA